jgi:hypothetical protein
MKRNKMIKDLSHEIPTETKQRVAFHEAGHVAGIHLNNKARQLPPVFFNINFQNMNSVADLNVPAYQTTQDNCIARVEGGRLIELLPFSINGLILELTDHNGGTEQQLMKDYMAAFEADIINLLVGPLAEAKHVANTDNELFNHKLVNLNALKNYGGSSDLALVNEYIQCFSVEKQQKEEKLDEIFTVAFEFINDDENWTAISKLADCIFRSHKNIICCEEIASILDKSVDHFQNQKNIPRH